MSLYYLHMPNVLKYWDLKIINFPFVPNGKFIIFMCPKIWANYSLILMCSNVKAPNNHFFSICDKWKNSGVRCPNT